MSQVYVVAPGILATENLSGWLGQVVEFCLEIAPGVVTAGPTFVVWLTVLGVALQGFVADAVTVNDPAAVHCTVAVLPETTNEPPPEIDHVNVS